MLLCGGGKIAYSGDLKVKALRGFYCFLKIDVFIETIYLTRQVS